MSGRGAAAAATAAAGVTHAGPGMAGGPPIRSGAAVAAGLSANAAPHNPAPASTAMLNRSMIFNVLPFSLPPLFPNSTAHAERYRCLEILPR